MGLFGSIIACVGFLSPKSESPIEGNSHLPSTRESSSTLGLDMIIYPDFASDEGSCLSYLRHQGKIHLC